MLLAVFLSLLLIIILTFLVNIYLEVILKRRQEDDYIQFKLWTLAGLLNFNFQINFIDFKEEFNRLVIEYQGSSGAGGLQDKAGEREGDPTGEIKLYPGILRNILQQLKALAKISTGLEAINQLLAGLFEAGLKLGRVPLSRAALSRLFLEVTPRIRLKTVRFSWETDLGLEDPALTGISAGLLWAIKGTALALLNRRSPLIKEPDLQVNPCFNRVVFATSFHGIFMVNLGQIIKSFFWLIESEIRRRLEKRWMNIPLRH